MRACHAERYPRGASCCQLNHIKNKLRQYLYLSQLILNANIISHRIKLYLQTQLTTEILSVELAQPTSSFIGIKDHQILIGYMITLLIKKLQM